MRTLILAFGGAVAGLLGSIWGLSVLEVIGVIVPISLSWAVIEGLDL